jgi:hypothetical protein
MPNRTPVILAAAGLMLGLAGPLSACASSAPGGTASHGTSPPAAAAPIVFVVRLRSAFSPRSLRLGVGQQFMVIVSKAVKVSGPDLAGACTSGVIGSATTGVLSVRCSAGGYLYTAEHVGSAVLSATVQPQCTPGTICPQWVADTSLKITVT